MNPNSGVYFLSDICIHNVTVLNLLWFVMLSLDGYCKLRFSVHQKNYNKNVTMMTIYTVVEYSGRANLEHSGYLIRPDFAELYGSFYT